MSSDFITINDQLPDLNEDVGDINEDYQLPDLNEPAEDFSQHEAHQTSPTGHHGTSRKRLSYSQRLEILLWLMNKATGCKLQRGAITEAASQFSLSKRCISKLWNTAKRQIQAGERIDVQTHMHNCGRKRIQVPLEAITALHMGDRSCIRDLATKLLISKTTTHRMIKRGIIKPHTNSLHPGLKDSNMKTRLAWILGLLKGDTAASKTTYYPMYDFVHLDEKWFYQSKKSHRVYLAKGEKAMYRSASSSKFIPKVMFTACVARPRYNIEGVCTFDGKIGVFPFTFKEPARRNSKNRRKGTIITKVIDSIKKRVIRSMLIEQILPSIMSKWPAEGRHQVIFIQQDNAKPHISQQDEEWQQVCHQPGFTFILFQQPPNSPDLNILDLGFFRSIQSLMHKKMPKDIDAMLDAVHQAFYELEPKTLTNVWVTLQYVMNEVLKAKGGNNYNLPHLNKRRLDANGILEEEVKAPMWAVMRAWDIIHENSQGNTQDHEDTQGGHEETQGDHIHEDTTAEANEATTSDDALHG